MINEINKLNNYSEFVYFIQQNGITCQLLFNNFKCDRSIFKFYNGDTDLSDSQIVFRVENIESIDFINKKEVEPDYVEITSKGVTVGIYCYK